MTMTGDERNLIPTHHLSFEGGRNGQGYKLEDRDRETETEKKQAAKGKERDPKRYQGGKYRPKRAWLS